MKIKELFKDKKTVIRIILFVAALILAATMFSRALLGLSKNKEGYQTIAAYPTEDAPLYANGFTFNYYFSGTSGEIRDKVKEVTAAYSNALSRAYKLLDAENEYAGYKNIASINKAVTDGDAAQDTQQQAAVGSDASGIRTVQVSVPEELYNALKDAYARTLTEEHFNMFAGDLYGYITGILILNEPQEFDPAINSDTAARLEGIIGLVNNPDHFKLEFLNDTERIVSFSVSEDYLAALEAFEVDAAPLNLGVLKDAYMLEMVRAELIKAGYTDGYITTKSGLTLALSKQKGLNYCIYGVKDENVAILDTVPNDGAAVYSSFKAFGFGNEAMYYAFAIGDEMYYRNPYFSLKTGYDNGTYLTLYSVCSIPESMDGSYHCAEAVCRNLKIWCGLSDSSKPDTGSDNIPAGDGYDTYYVYRNNMSFVNKS